VFTVLTPETTCTHAAAAAAVHDACYDCRARAALEESLVAEELERLLSEYVEGRVKDVLASEHVQASLATRLAVSTTCNAAACVCAWRRPVGIRAAGGFGVFKRAGQKMCLLAWQRDWQ
jgi:hypothetical protein